MNAARRKEVEDIVARLSAVKGDLERIRDDEQGYYDNIPENLQSGQNATNSETASERIESALNSVEEAVQELEGGV